MVVSVVGDNVDFCVDCVVEEALSRVDAGDAGVWLVAVIGIAYQALVLALLLGGTALLWVAGYFDRDPVHIYGNPADGSPVAAVYFSGDMGLHLGMEVPDWPPEDIEALAKKYDDHL